VVAASAISGFICGPEQLSTSTQYLQRQAPNVKLSIQEVDRAQSDSGEIQLLPGFPAEFVGRILFCPADNLNTDGIYPGKYTYRDDMTPEMMAKVVMENYDTKFSSLVKKVSVNSFVCLFIKRK
jgi:homoaconitate hydratase